MADKFYSFIWNDRAYVGELTGSNSKTSCLEYHFKRCLPWKNNFKENTKGNDDALERSLFYSLREWGGKENIESLSEIIEVDASTVISSIKDSLDSYVFNNFKNKHCPYNKETYKIGKFYEDIMKYFGRGSKNAPIRVPEMLLILLRSKEFAMWNTHANYGPRFKYVDGLENYINVKVLQQREKDTQRLKPYIMLTFDISEVPFAISNIIQNLSGKKRESINKKTGHDQIAIDILKNPDFVKVFNKVVRDTTIKTVREQLQDFVDKALSQNEDWQSEQVRNDVLNFIKELDTYKGKRYSTLVKAINDSMSKYKEIDFKPTDFKTFKDFSIFLLGWLKSVSFSNFMSGSNNDLQKLTTWYKSEFTKYIQSICFPAVTDLEYHRWKQNIRDNIWLASFDNLYMQPGAFYPTYLREKEEDYDGISLCVKTFDKLWNENNNFILNNWTDHIYPEQVAYFLNTAEGAEPFNYDSMSSTFISVLEDTEQINWY